MINSWSRHSRRTVPTQRSAAAFALNACTGVQITSALVERHTSLNTAPGGVVKAAWRCKRTYLKELGGSPGRHWWQNEADRVSVGSVGAVTLRRAAVVTMTEMAPYRFPSPMG
jgi:hypothetical protein